MITSFKILGQEGGGGGGGVTSYDDLSDKPKLNNVTIRGSLTLQDINVYSIDEVNDLLADKAQAEFVDQLPATPEENTWYYSKKFQDGTDVPNDKRALYIVLEDVTTYNYMGVAGDIDLTNYYTKNEVDNKVFDLTTANFRRGVITTRITDTVTNSTIPTGSAVRSALTTKQDTLIASDQFTAPSDTDKLSSVSGVTNNRWTFAKVWDWVVSKLTANTEKGIQVSEGKIGHSNSITAQTNNRIYAGKLDAQGHFSETPTALNYSGTYTSDASNQLFTRTGAYNMYTALNNGKQNKAWSYVGILGAGTGNTITVKDDWTELLFVMRLSEGSNVYNVNNTVQKEAFTQGSPTNNTTFIGFTWNSSYYVGMRISLRGTGDSRNVKVDYTTQSGWNNNGVYVLKR